MRCLQAGFSGAFLTGLGNSCYQPRHQTGLIGSASERRNRIAPMPGDGPVPKIQAKSARGPAITAMLSAVSLPGSTGTAP
jgi:hypothetical protein